MLELTYEKKKLKISNTGKELLRGTVKCAGQVFKFITPATTSMVVDLPLFDIIGYRVSFIAPGDTKPTNMYYNFDEDGNFDLSESGDRFDEDERKHEWSHFTVPYAVALRLLRDMPTSELIRYMPKDLVDKETPLPSAVDDLTKALMFITMCVQQYKDLDITHTRAEHILNTAVLFYGDERTGLGEMATRAMELYGNELLKHYNKSKEI